MIHLRSLPEIELLQISHHFSIMIHLRSFPEIKLLQISHHFSIMIHLRSLPEIKLLIVTLGKFIDVIATKKIFKAQ